MSHVHYFGPSMFRWEHPWDLAHLTSSSNSELKSIYDQIERGFKNGDIAPFSMDGMRQMQRRIKRVLQGRGKSTFDMWDAWDFDSGDRRGVGFLHRASPSFVIGQTVQQGVINLPNPQPNITFQSIPAPPPNITFQTIHAPQPAAPLSAPELPKRIRFRDQWGNIVEERDETEQEKSDREYKEWKEKFGTE